MTPKDYANMLAEAGDPFWAQKAEEQGAAERLAIIIANFVSVNRMAPEAVDALAQLFDQIKAPERLRAFWDDRIAQGKRLAEGEG